MNKQELITNLNESFGSYKAEWLKSNIFNLFAEPSYFVALQDNRPCVLEGGRGSGKTTALRGLSYQGQFALHNRSIDVFKDLKYVGIYYKVNTNHVRAFTGADLTDNEWGRIFSHYINLAICREISTFLLWHEENIEAIPIDIKVLSLVCRMLHVSDTCTCIEDFHHNLNEALYDFQSQINNVNSASSIKLSMPFDPVNILAECILSCHAMYRKMIYILMDEYENFSDYQQVIVNTYIKHSNEYVTFKIGVRELGWRLKHTLNSQELLHDPADYVLVNIERALTDTGHFSDFAKSVCEQRMQKLFSSDNAIGYEINNALTKLTPEAEAELLGVRETKHYLAISPKLQIGSRLQQTPLLAYFVSYWAFWHSTPIEDAVKDFELFTAKWVDRYDNYKYEMLFKIRKGRGRGGIQKYYCGWTTFITISNGNIRYLMELFYRSYERHINDDRLMTEPVSPKTQTEAAQAVGFKNLMELEGLWKNGAQLTKLLLGFGRVFQVMAGTEGRFAPERNQFSLENSESLTEECQEIVTAAVMNLALVRSAGNKLDSDFHTKDYLYFIHPIYAAYFEFSHRKKRKISVSQAEFISIVTSPKTTIRTILRRNKVVEETPILPEQMNLFESFYND